MNTSLTIKEILHTLNSYFKSNVICIFRANRSGRPIPKASPAFTRGFVYRLVVVNIIVGVTVRDLVGKHPVSLSLMGTEAFLVLLSNYVQLGAIREVALNGAARKARVGRFVAYSNLYTGSSLRGELASAQAANVAAFADLWN